MQFQYRSLIILLTLFITSVSCKKLVSVPPPINSVNSVNIYSSDATSIAVLTGIYTNMSSLNVTASGITSLFLYGSLSADELTLFDINNVKYKPYYTNSLTNANAVVDYWKVLYPVIYE